MAKVKPLLKILASIWIVYNLIVLMVMPNLNSYFGRVAGRYIGPYANFVGLNTGWTFFSPDPVQPMHIKIVVNFPTAEDGSSPEPIYDVYPPEESVSAILRVRQISAMRYMVMDPRRLKQVFGPWICKKHPGAESVDMEQIVDVLPVLDEAVSKKDLSPMEISRQGSFAKATVYCNRPLDEEIL